MSQTLKGTSLYGQTGSAEDAMRISAVRFESKDIHEKNMYFDAAKRVVFKNCMASCDISDEQVPNFNANFYYNQLGEQKCLSTCFNTKMDLHFGATTAQREGLYMDFEAKKAEYQNYERWNPATKVLKKYEKGMEEDKVQDMTEKLLAKTKKATNPGFQFN